MSRIHNATTRKAAAARSAEALHRPELTRPGDGIPRKASTGAVSPMVKTNDPETQRLIDEALERRCPRDLLSAG